MISVGSGLTLQAMNGRKRRRVLRVGIIELLTGGAPSRKWVDRTYAAYFNKQYASITPQAVAVWCRQLGHDVVYATYYGQSDPKGLIPSGLDVVFVGASTRARTWLPPRSGRVPKR